MKRNVWLFGVIVIVVAVVSWCAGYQLGSRQTKIKHSFIPIIGKVHRDTLKVPIVIRTTIPVDVDTAGIIRDYYNRLVYDDTLQLPNNIGYVSTRDTIFNNRIAGRTYDYNITIPKIKYNNELMISGDIGYNLRLLSIGYRRNNWTYKIGYDCLNNGLVLGINYRIYQW